MMDLHGYLKLLIKRKDLDQRQAEELLDQLTGGSASPEMTAAILSALASKNESAVEIVGFIKGMRKLMLNVDAPTGAIDIVGTGGDGSNSFNISTVSALVVASCGVFVAKHGNRAASSKCGSADVLESLGVSINLDPKKTKEVLGKVGMVFLFAPSFHPAMKIVGPIRKELRVRTIFNYLGPFLNPAKVKRMLLGVANLETAKKFLEIAKKLDFKHLIIVTSKDGMDEISIASKTHVFELKNGKTRKFIIDPKKLGFKKYTKSELEGGDPKMNAQIARDILSGKEQEAKKDVVILNSAYALVVSGKVQTIKEGIKMANEAIDSGKAFKLLDSLIKESNK